MKRITQATLLFVAISFINHAQAFAGLPDFTGLVEKHSPAVVNISTKFKDEKKEEDNNAGSREDFDDLLRRYFDFDEAPRGKENSLGSGFIISPDGYVITNHHVINEADEVIVKLSDRRELVAKIIGSDPRSDIALLKLDSEDLPVLEMGKSKTLKPGEWVVAIGSPFGFDHSVTAGIVSAKGRSLPSENYVPFIQTDVAINPGNSGGPLFNLKGEVVGINSQIYSRTGGFMGLSFAIPIDVAKDVIDQLKNKGKVSRGWLGVVIQEVTRDLAKSFNMKQIEGALVSQVLDESPSKGILKQGDIIIEFDGKSVPTVADLPVIVGQTAVGSTVEIKLIRDGAYQTVKMTIGELPENINAKETNDKEKAQEKPKENIVMGMVIEDLDEKSRTSMEISKGGVLVKRIKGGSAKEAGIRAGDILTRFGGKTIKSAEHFTQLVSKRKAGDIVALLVRSDDSARFVAIKVE